MEWRKARLSAAENGCVELAFSADGRSLGMVRDSKSPERGHLAVPPSMLATLITDAKAGRLDLR